MVTARGRSPAEEELRIVLLGRVGAGKSKVAKFLLGSKEPKGRIGLCIIREGEAAGRRICLVDTPGWDQRSIYNTPEKIKSEIVKSPTLCPPGPHALIVVLCVESLTDAPSTKELETVSEHMELLSKRVWKHTMLLFLCDEDVEDPIINKHIQNANRLLEKCGNRHFVLRSEAQVPEFLQEVEKVVEGNCDDFFLPQIYHNYMQIKGPQNVTEMKMNEDREEELKRGYQTRTGAYNTKQAGNNALRQRCGSLQGDRPSINDDDQTVDTVATKSKFWKDHKPAIALALTGDLVGSVGESVYGVKGSCVGLVTGVILLASLSLCWTGSASLAEKKFKYSVREKTHYMERVNYKYAFGELICCCENILICLYLSV